MTRRTIKAWYLVHKWTSLVSMVFLLLLCVTGLPLIFHHEIDHALGYSVEAPEL
ncbi:MAG: PepSY domain-containing protein, partial [Thermoanaerobaculia bacterium]